MKKLVCVVLACLLAGLCACGARQTREANAAPTTAETTIEMTTAEKTTTERFTIVLDINASAAERYKAVLRGQMPYVSKDYRTGETYEEYLVGNMASRRFAVLDVNGDGAMEVVVNRLVLQWNGSEVRGFGLPNDSIKADGTLFIEAGAFKQIARLNANGDLKFIAATEHTGVMPTPDFYYFDDDMDHRHSGQAAMDKYYKLYDAYVAKPEPAWLEFTDENIEKAFG